LSDIKVNDPRGSYASIADASVGLGYSGRT